MTLANYFLFVSIFLDICSLKLAADCQKGCEQSRGSIGKAGMKNLAMQGHSFRNYTLSKPYDCHVKCFEEKCKCQAYQIRENRCELLDEDRFSAPEDFFKEKGYTYYDMNREYVNQVTSESNIQCAEVSYYLRDYLRAKLNDIDVMRLNFDGCKKYEFISIRGYNCSNCTAQFVQTDNWHAHTDSFWGPKIGCQFTSQSTGAVRLLGGEDNFGWYQTVNPAHRCTSSNDSTTQWWLGVLIRRH
ncbi:unnamed protein product [Porites evermanni]|uniref:Apple domain-containing protein n=1 Tax=Porites evermanni TaxID=104178 RepID=A0ABN8LNK5_9CNID|nr:unnamed protein product [Porites evermanni]